MTGEPPDELRFRDVLAEWQRVPGYTELFDGCVRVPRIIHLGRPPYVRGHVDPILWATAARSGKTTNAVCALCIYGFGEQAGMLCRSLFEDMAVAWWLRDAEPRTVRELFETSQTRWHAEREEQLIKHGKVDDAVALGLLGDGRRREIFAQRRPALWVGKGVYAIVKDIETHWPPDERALLWEMHDLTHNLHNNMLHHTPLAMNLTMPAGRLSSRRSDQYVPEALRSALYCIGHLGRAVLREESLATLEAALTDLRPVLVVLPQDRVAGVGRNDPCPCGSGRKFKTCHGA
jgi:hypothetical protein